MAALVVLRAATLAAALLPCLAAAAPLTLDSALDLAAQRSVQARAAPADTRLQTASAYLETWYAGEALKLMGLTERHLHEELEAARARLAAATGSSPEVLALVAARGMAEDETAEVRQQLSAAQLSLQRWTGMPPGDLAPAAAMAVPPEQAYVAAHPEVLALQRDIDVAEQSAVVAASERRANWTWEVSYGQRTGYADMLSFGVSIPLQVAPAERQDRDTAAKRAQVEKVQAELAEAIRAATAEYQALASDAQRLQARIDRYRDAVLTPTQQRTAATMVAYRSNQAPLASLFEARHAEVEAQRKLLNLQRELAKTQARLAFKPLTPGAAP